ncbi:hypothetical protein HYU16_00145 [Candidatus Woesearchaeota archaeon]|nr:hypothetical protein [Candidatus Woesearchaeota archaeon]
MTALLLAVLVAACTAKPDGAYQAQPQQLPTNIEQNIAQEQPPQQVQIVQEEKPHEEGAQDRFYYVSRLHWPRMPVTYFIENEEGCGRYEANRIRRAFRDISNATGNAVLFAQANDSGSADIEIRCTFIEDCYELSTDIRDDYVIRTETICQHPLGITKTLAEGNRLTKAYIEMVGLAGFAETKHEGPSGFYVGTCGHTTTEIHELLHAFGYGHSEDNSSIMSPEADVFGLTIQREGACKGSTKAIDAAIVAELVNTYSGKAGN